MKTILLVDIEIESLFGISDNLARLGYGTIAMQDGQTALSVIEDGMPIDLVIVAEKTHGIDGLSLLGLIKERFPYIPSIMLAECCSIETYLKARSLGAFEYISKSVRLIELGRIVKEALEAGHVIEDAHGALERTLSLHTA